MQTWDKKDPELEEIAKNWKISYHLVKLAWNNVLRDTNKLKDKLNRKPQWVLKFEEDTSKLSTLQ